MALALSSPLPAFHPVLNPLIVSFQDPLDLASDRLGNSLIEVQLEIEDVFGSDSWRLIGEFLNPYDYDTDVAKVVLNNALTGVFATDPSPILSATITEIPGVMKRYRVKARDVVDGIPVGEFAIVGTSFAWNAGSKYILQDTDIIGNRSYYFLSVRPAIRRIHPDEPISIQFVVFNSSPDVCTLNATLTYTDDTVENIDYPLPVLVAGKAYTILLPNPGSGFAKPVKKILYGITGIFDTSNESAILNTIVNPSPWYKLVYFKNSLGGWESIACMGKSEEFSTASGEVFEAQEYPVTEAKTGNTRSYNQRATDSFVFRTGWMPKAEHTAMRDLLLRNEAYHYSGSKLLKLVISNSAFKVHADDEYLFATEFTARYAYEEVAYGR